MRAFASCAFLGVASLGSLSGCNDGTISNLEPQDVCRRSAALVERPAPRLLLSEALLDRLTERAAANDAQWLALRSRCTDLASATMNPPSGVAYPPRPNVGIGYQGDEYVEPAHSLGLCYRVASQLDSAEAARYAEAGERLLIAMSTAESEGGFRVSTNSGYGIRHFGLAMTIGYDWLYPALSNATRMRVIASLNAFIDWYDEAGFLRNDPIANYFVGYFQTKTFTALATAGDNPKAEAYWSDVETRLWGELLEPAFSELMVGGGWPEGWGYGPRAVRGLIETLWGVETARNLGWLNALSYVHDTGPYLTHFSWPSLQRMDDYGTVRSGVAFGPSVGLLTSLASALDGIGDPYGGRLRTFADDVIANTKDTRHDWEKFFYSDPRDVKHAYSDDRLSHFASGPGHVAARSSWDTDAVWMSLNAGPYINAKDSGEQLFNAGEISFVAGGDPILVRATGWIPHVAGTAGENYVYANNFGGGGRRLYNTFYVDDPGNVYNPGQAHVNAEESRTEVTHFEDAGRWVRARGSHLEDQYGLPGRVRPVTAFTRDLVYVRPGNLVLYDRTEVPSASSDQWLAFHMPASPTQTGPATFDLTSGSARGRLQMHLPDEASVRSETLLGGVVRLEEHSSGATGQQWLTVVSTGSELPTQERLSAEDGNVFGGDVIGVHLQAREEQVVLFPNSMNPGALTSEAEYTVQQLNDALHVIVDIAPSATGYSVVAQHTTPGLRVRVIPGGAIEVSPSGTLSFRLTAEGQVEQNAPTSVSPGGIPSSAPPSTDSAMDPGGSAPTPVTNDPGVEPPIEVTGSNAQAITPHWRQLLPRATDDLTSTADGCGSLTP